MAGFRLSNPGFLSVVGLAFDPAAAAIIANIEGPSGDNQALEATVRNAINAFVVGCKADGIYTLLASGVFRFLAGPRTLAGCIRAGVGANPANFGFVAGDLTRATGLKGNGVNKYLALNRNNNVDGQNNRHLSVGVSEPQSTGTGAYIGSGVSSPGDANIGSNRTANDIFFRLTNGTAAAIPGPSGATGMQGVNRLNSTQVSTRLANTTTLFDRDSATPLNEDLKLFRRGDILPAYSDARLHWYSAGPSLGATGLALLDARLATFISNISGI